MNVPSRVYGALSRALAPPRGDPRAFPELCLRAPDARELAAEHAALFGRAGYAVLSPYGALRCRTSLHEILTAYARVGYSPDPSFRDRPDHVCIWLAVLEGLGRDAEATPGDADAASASQARDILARFVRQYAEPWLPGLFLEMALLDGYPLHRRLAHQANWFLTGGRHAQQAAEHGAAAHPETDELICTACGKPTGLLKPDVVSRLPSWSSTCVRCRLRTDLRRSAS